MPAKNRPAKNVPHQLQCLPHHTTLPQTPVAAGPPKKKRKHNHASTPDDHIEALLAKELAACSADRAAAEAEDELTLFGREVAESIRSIKEEYQQALLMRDIRDVIFRRRYPQSHQPSTSARYYEDTEAYRPTFTNLYHLYKFAYILKYI